MQRQWNVFFDKSQAKKHRTLLVISSARHIQRKLYCLTSIFPSASSKFSFSSVRHRIFLYRLARTRKPLYAQDAFRDLEISGIAHSHNSSTTNLLPSDVRRTTQTHFTMALDTFQLRDEAVRDRIRLATEFLDPTDDNVRSYRADIVLMLNRGLRRLVVSIDDIRTHSRELADGILYKPFDYSLAFDAALKNIIGTIPNRPPYEQDEDRLYYVAYSGSFGENTCNPRTLGSSLLNRMVCLEGIVTKCSLVRPKVVKSVHWNENKQTFHFREYRDQTMSANGPASLSVYPQEDGDGNPVS